MRTLLLVLVCLSRESVGVYDAERKIEHARLYGNVDYYAYYFVDLVVGTPAQRVSVILDTGSAVCAYPCASCKHCGHHIDPAFDVGKSSTAKWLQCSSGRCPVGRCQSGKCGYYQGYTEGSSISGFWFEDKVSLGDMIQHNPQVTARMGCHSNENNLFFTQKANGIFGIGPSALSGQAILDKIFKDGQHVTHKVFSICLAEWGGQFNVGGYDDSYHTGPVQRTRLKPSSFYSVHLTSMKVNGVTVSTTWGSTMIDSGTTYTYMRSSNYRALRDTIENYCRGHSCGGTKHGTKCWTLSDGPSKFPHISVLFDGIETKWVPKAYLYRKGSSQTYCYGFEDDGPSANTVLGAVWMMHQDIVFDMEKSEVGIAAAKCPEYKDRPSHVAAKATTTTAAPITTTTAATTTQATTTPSTSQSTVPTTTTLAPTTATTDPASVPHVLFAAATAQSSTSTRSVSTSSSFASVDDPASNQKGVVKSTILPRGGTGSTTPPGSQEIPARFLGQDPLQFIGAIVVGILTACFCLFVVRKVCFRPEQHRHVKLKEDEESGMPPQIVGQAGEDAGFDAFVIGDDETEHLDTEGFEYVPQNFASQEPWPMGGAVGSAQPPKESCQSKDLLGNLEDDHWSDAKTKGSEPPRGGVLDGPLD